MVDLVSVASNRELMNKASDGAIEALVELVRGRSPAEMAQQLHEAELERAREIHDWIKNMSLLVLRYGDAVPSGVLAKGRFQYDELMIMVAQHLREVLEAEAEGGRVPNDNVIASRLKSLHEARVASDMTDPELDLYAEAVRGSLTPAMADESEAVFLLRLIRERRVTTALTPERGALASGAEGPGVPRGVRSRLGAPWQTGAVFGLVFALRGEPARSSPGFRGGRRAPT